MSKVLYIYFSKQKANQWFGEPFIAQGQLS